MTGDISKMVLYDEEGINYDDIPEVTNFSKAVKNPHAVKYIKNGKFIAVIEHDGYNEVVEYDVNTGKKTVLKLTIVDSRIIVEDKRISV